MLIKVNKKISASKAVHYSALSSGLNMATSSGVWHDEETSNLGTAKRQNRIRVTRINSVVPVTGASVAQPTNL
jgi:hypothetical protein